MQEECRYLYGDRCGKRLPPLCGGGLFLLKEFKTIDEQIELLKIRGLVINDEQAAKLYLLTNNYYLKLRRCKMPVKPYKI